MERERERERERDENGIDLWTAIYSDYEQLSYLNSAEFINKYPFSLIDIPLEVI